MHNKMIGFPISEKELARLFIASRMSGFANEEGILHHGMNDDLHNYDISQKYNDITD